MYKPFQPKIILQFTVLTASRQIRWLKSSSHVEISHFLCLKIVVTLQERTYQLLFWNGFDVGRATCFYLSWSWWLILAVSQVTAQVLVRSNACALITNNGIFSSITGKTGNSHSKAHEFVSSLKINPSLYRTSL